LVAASYFLNPLCFYLSPVALVVVCFYSLTKRFTDYTHVFLGIALALAPVGAWLAVKGANVSFLEILQMTLLALAVCCGSSASTSFTRCKITSSTNRTACARSSWRGGRKTRWPPRFWRTWSCADCCSRSGCCAGFRIAYLIGWFIIVGCLVLEHWIARRRSLNWINLAFFRLNALVSAVFLIVVAAEVIFQGGFKLR
jgi:4-hydroxybenzoate polyprenyltransferase